MLVNMLWMVISSRACGSSGREAVMLQPGHAGETQKFRQKYLKQGEA